MRVRVPDTMGLAHAVQKHGTRVSSPTANGGQVDLKKLLTLIVVALALFFVFTRPQTAGNLVTDGLGLLRDGAEQVVAFITAIV
jgi:hypothetical protein